MPSAITGEIRLTEEGFIQYRSNANDTWVNIATTVSSVTTTNTSGFYYYVQEDPVEELKLEELDIEI
jgi:hypothetical protein